MTPIFKKGSKSDLNNYRPISVLPIVSKLFEKIIYQQLYDYLDKNKLLNTYQSGFRSLHSTMTALLETTNNWSINIDNGLLNGVVYIDLKKAFDTIDHAILLRKLANYGLDLGSLRFFASYLGNRSQKCYVNGVLSSPSELDLETEEAKKGPEMSANIAQIEKVTRIFLLAKNTHDKYRKNRKNNKCNKILDVESKKAKKGPQMSANIAKIAKVRRIFPAS